MGDTHSATVKGRHEAVTSLVIRTAPQSVDSIIQTQVDIISVIQPTLRDLLVVSRSRALLGNSLVSTW